MPSERELRLESVLERGDAKLVQPRDLGLCERLERKICERRSAPECKRLAKCRRPLGRLELARGFDRAFEAERVDAVAVDVQ